MFDEMGWEIVLSGNRLVEDAKWIGVRTSGMKVSGGIWAEAKLEQDKIRHVQMKRSNAHHAVLFNFLDDDDIAQEKRTNPLLAGVYLLHHDGGAKIRRRKTPGGIIQTGSFVKNTPWLWSIATQKDPAAKRFVPEPGATHRQWMVRFVPEFINDSRVEDCAARLGLRGIYEMKNNEGQVIYIGQGDIKSRLRKHIYDDNIRPVRIAWTQIEDDAVRLSAEAYHLRRHETRYGQLPLYNFKGAPADTKR